MADLVDMSALSLEEMYAQRILADEKRARETNPDEPDYVYGRLYLARHRTFEAIDKIAELEENWQNYKFWKDYVDRIMKIHLDFKYISDPNYANEDDPMDQGIKEVLEDTLAARLIDCIADVELAESLQGRSSMDILLALERGYAAFEREELSELVDLAVASMNITEPHQYTKTMMEDRLKTLSELRSMPAATLAAFFLSNLQEFTTASGDPTMSTILFKRGLVEKILQFKPELIDAHREMYGELCDYTKEFMTDPISFCMDQKIVNFPAQSKPTASVARPSKKNKQAGDILKKMECHDGLYSVPDLPKALVMKCFINQGVCPICLNNISSKNHKCDV